MVEKSDDETEQAKRLRTARRLMELRNGELADMLGVSPSTLHNWLSPPTSRIYREMPKPARLLLEHLLKQHRDNKKAGR